MGAGKYADEGVVIEVEQQAASDAADKQRHDGDEGSDAYPAQTFGGKHCADEVAPDTESYAGQEDADEKKAAICQNRIAAIGNVNSQEDLEIPSQTILDSIPFSGRLHLKG